jgi:hypothetical protein
MGAGIGLSQGMGDLDDPSPDSLIKAVLGLDQAAVIPSGLFLASSRKSGADAGVHLGCIPDGGQV